MPYLPKTSKNFNCFKCPQLIYPKNKTGIPFSGNGNTPGNLLTPGMKCSTKIKSAERGKNYKVYRQNVNESGRVVGVLYGSSAPPRNSF